MATFKHLLGGNVQSRRVIVSNGYDAATPVTITIQQPANSQIVGGHYRQLQVATVANTGDVGIDVGVEGALTSIFSDTNNDSIADGVSGATEIPVGFFFDFATGAGISSSQFSTGSIAAPALSDGYTAEDRDILITVTSSQAVTAATGESADYEVQLDFKMLGS
jgi:hypothetical protein